MSSDSEIRSLLQTFVRALNTSDAPGALACYSSDGVAMAQGMPTLSGAELTDSYAQFFKTVKMDVEFAVDEVVVGSDDVAYALTRSTGTMTILETGDKNPESNREVFLFGREDGAWKIRRYLFNTQ